MCVCSCCTTLYPLLFSHMLMFSHTDKTKCEVKAETHLSDGAAASPASEPPGSPSQPTSPRQPLDCIPVETVLHEQSSLPEYLPAVSAAATDCCFDQSNAGLSLSLQSTLQPDDSYKSKCKSLVPQFFCLMFILCTLRAPPQSDLMSSDCVPRFSLGSRRVKAGKPQNCISAPAA